MNDSDGDRHLDTQTDEELMQAFKKGDTPAFRQLFERYKNPVFAFVRRRLNDPGRAEEITQDIFLALIQHRNGYEARASSLQNCPEPNRLRASEEKPERASRHKPGGGGWRRPGCRPAGSGGAGEARIRAA